jgi:hypothetical protein
LTLHEQFYLFQAWRHYSFQRDVRTDIGNDLATNEDENLTTNVPQVTMSNPLLIATTTAAEDMYTHLKHRPEIATNISSPVLNLIGPSGGMMLLVFVAEHRNASRAAKNVSKK